MSFKQINILIVSVLLSLATFANAYALAVLGTTAAGNQALVIPDPGTNLPTPTINITTGLPAGASPHGVSFYAFNRSLVSDFQNNRVFVIDIVNNVLMDTINTGANFDGSGSIAVSPLLNYALASGTNTTLTTIQAPFTAGSTQATVALPGSIAQYQTQAIVFNAAGRAFVYTTAGIAVLDSPYNAVAFTIPVVGNGASGAIAISPNGNTLLVTTLASANVQIFNAPFSAASTATTLAVGGFGLDGIVIAPNGTNALVVDAAAGSVFSIQFPFTAASTVETLAVPGTLTDGFEDIDIDPTSQLAIVTGNSTGQNALFIQAPFTAAGATMHSVAVPNGGRGNGAVRFLPAALQPTAANLTITKAGPATVAQNAQITYTITYSNTGQTAATNVVIRDTLPANTTFVSATNGGALNANEVSWNIGTVAGNTTNQTVQFTVQSNALVGTTITNAVYSIEATGIAAIAGAVPVATGIGGAPVIPVNAQPVPTLSEWLMVLLATMLMGIAGFRLRQS